MSLLIGDYNIEIFKYIRFQATFDTMVEIPKEYWLYDISPSLDRSDIIEKRRELIKLELENQLGVLRDYETYLKAKEEHKIFGLPINLNEKGVNKKRRSIQEDHNHQLNKQVILQKYPKYLRALQTYMKAILAMNEADIILQENNICKYTCDTSYSRDKTCPMGHPGGCDYEPEGKKSLRVQIFEESEKYEKESDRLYNKVMEMFKDMGLKKVHLPKPTEL